MNVKKRSGEEVVINNYDDFVRCVKKSNDNIKLTYECRSDRYDRALGKLIADNRQLFIEYTERMKREFRRDKNVIF